MPKDKPRVVCTVACRMTSTRLPGKILKPILGRPALELLIERIKRVRGIDEIVIATTTNAADDVVVEHAKRLGLAVFRGSELDVLGRIAGAAATFKADVVVELTSDNIVIDPDGVQRCLDAYLAGGVDYVANGLVRTYPIGMDAQVFSGELIQRVAELATEPDDREHVGLYIYMRPKTYRVKNVPAPAEATWPELHLTLDTAADYALLLSAVYEGIYPSNPTFTVADIITYLKANPKIAALNGEVKRKKIITDYFAQTGHSPE
jgi:spore coat polysaccharide biosynthesis protein SpsF